MPTHETKGEAMSDHVIQVVADDGELRFDLVCNAPEDAWCRRRPSEYQEDQWVDEWIDTDPDLVDGPCWAVEWIDAAGLEGMRAEGVGVWVTIPVEVSYDEGVVVVPASASSIED